MTGGPYSKGAHEGEGAGATCACGYSAAPGGARGALVRLRERWRRAPLALTFAVYFSVCLAASTFCALALMQVLDSAGARAWSLSVDAEGGALAPRRLFSGPYLYDAEARELVPASELSFPDEESGTVFLGISGDGGSQRRAAGGAGEDADGVPAGDELAYATLDEVRAGKVKLYDWGLNYTEAATQDEVLRDGGEIPADMLAGYDARQRGLRLDAASALKGAGAEKGMDVGDGAGAASEDGGGAADAEDGLFSGVPVSNVAYYAVRAERESAPAALFRFVRGVAPLAVYAAFFWVAARRFYRIHLSAPLAELERAAARVAAQDLDFRVPEVRGRELGALGGAFERMRGSLAEAQRSLWATAEERRRLNAAFAHDLRTPLTVLKGTVEMAQAQLSAGAPVSPETCRTLAAQVERLERYTRAMSKAAKLEDRELACEECSYADVSASLEEECRMLVAARGEGLAFSFEGAVPDVPAAKAPVLLDQALVLEAVGNVVNNACAHARGHVGVSLAYEGGVLDVRVADDGEGFSAEALRRGCEPFYSEAKSAEHFGMGLNIACVLARLHGGDVVLGNLSEPGKGACVHVRFRAEGR